MDRPGARQHHWLWVVRYRWAETAQGRGPGNLLILLETWLCSGLKKVLREHTG